MWVVASRTQRGGFQHLPGPGAWRQCWAQLVCGAAEGQELACMCQVSRAASGATSVAFNICPVLCRGGQGTRLQRLLCNLSA